MLDMIDCQTELKKMNGCAAFLDAVYMTSSLSTSTVSLLNMFLPADKSVSCESLNETTADTAVDIACEGFAQSVHDLIAKVLSYVVKPFSYLRGLETKLTKLVQSSIGKLGDATGLYTGTISEDKARLIVQGVEAAAGIVCLFFSGVGRAIARAAKFSGSADSFLGKTITGINEFKWPFGQFKVGMGKGARLKHTTMEFIKTTTDDIYPAKWNVAGIKSFATGAVKALGNSITRVGKSSAGGLEGLGRSVHDILIRPVLSHTYSTGMMHYVKGGNYGVSVSLVLALRALTSFSMFIIGRFFVKVITQAYQAFASLFRGTKKIVEKVV